MKALNDDIQMRSDWFLPLCTGAGAAAQPARPEAASDPEARGAAAPRAAGQHRAGRHRARPVPRHRHDGRGGQAAAPALHRHRAPPRLCRGRDRPGPARPGPRRRRVVGRRVEARRAARAVRQPGGARAAAARAPSCSTACAGSVPWWPPTAPVVAGAARGSIHKVGAAVQNAPACNGWTFWHFERDGRLVALDALRDEPLGP